jgi:carbamoyl-phosphate synthase small subunit
MKDNSDELQRFNVAKRKVRGALLLEDGSSFEGYSFGYERSVSGEVIFNTGMVSYPESLTDPSCKGQILTTTNPHTGNYGTPFYENHVLDHHPVFESHRIQVQGLIVSHYFDYYRHWISHTSLSDWLKDNEVPALTGIDTRTLTKKLREKGTMSGKIIISDNNNDFFSSKTGQLAPQVSIKRPLLFKRGKTKVVVIDCGCKNSIIYSLLSRNITVLKVPFDYDFLHEDFDGLLISNGPGNPKMYKQTISQIREAIRRRYPIFGIGLGHQLLALAAGADTCKLKCGHRSHVQSCIEIGTRRSYITLQNHGYAVINESLPHDWESWFIDTNDSTNEGIRCTNGPFMSVQFHPEPFFCQGSTKNLYDKFVKILHR